MVRLLKGGRKYEKEFKKTNKKKTCYQVFKVAAQCGLTISNNSYLHSPCKFVNEV